MAAVKEERVKLFYKIGHSINTEYIFSQGMGSQVVLLRLLISDHKHNATDIDSSVKVGVGVGGQLHLITILSPHYKTSHPAQDQ